MLYLFAGTDTKKKIVSLEKLLGALPEGVETFSVSRNNFSRDQIESLVSGMGLFSKNYAMVFENILESEEHKSFLATRLESYKDSSNYFIFSESKLPKTTLDMLKKGRAELNIFDLPPAKAERFNSFVLANALGDRNKLNLWINYRLALGHGASLEELSGILFWKAKDMILKKNFAKFSRTELENFSSRISYLLPQARREGLDAEAALEEFLLEAF